MEDALKKYLDHLKETDQLEAYEIIRSEFEAMQWKIDLASSTAESLLALIEFCANHKTFANGNVHQGYDEGIVKATDTIKQCEINMRKLNKWGKLPWEIGANDELVTKKNS